MEPWHLLLFVVLDMCFFSTLLGMSSCMSRSDLAYVSDWIMTCKQGDNAQQAMPVLVAVMFVLIVQCQLDWMVRVACSTPKPRGAPSANAWLLHPILSAGTTVQEPDAQLPVPALLRTAVVAFKLACVLGIIFVFMYDHEYATEHREFVYTHYYGVVLVCVGLTGLMQITWWQLEQALNNGKLLSQPHSSPMQLLEHRSFFVGDVFLFVVVVFFFSATLLARSDNSGAMHNGAVISEFITLGLLWLQLVYLFWRCAALLSVEPIVLHDRLDVTTDTYRFALVFVVLMIPYVVIRSS